MYTVIIEELENLLTNIDSEHLCEDPWPHYVIDGFFSEKNYAIVKDFKNDDVEYDIIQEEGRTDYRLVEDVSDNLELSDRLNAVSRKVFHKLCDKFGLAYNDTHVNTTVSFWEDTDEFRIGDVHVDVFARQDSVISLLIYLVDESMTEYGTSLYTYTGDNISDDAMQDPGMLLPHTAFPDRKHKFQLVKEVESLPNRCLILGNDPSAWHRAPAQIKQGDVRRALMIRLYTVRDN